MTETELREEMQYRVNERLAILCGNNEPTPEQLVMAIRESETACDKLRSE